MVIKLYQDIPPWLVHPEHASGRVEIGWRSILFGSRVVVINYVHRSLELADGRRFKARTNDSPLEEEV